MVTERSEEQLATLMAGINREMESAVFAFQLCSFLTHLQDDNRALIDRFAHERTGYVVKLIKRFNDLMICA